MDFSWPLLHHLWVFPSILMSAVAEMRWLIRSEGSQFQKPRRHCDVVREGCREAPNILFHLTAKVLGSKTSIVAWRMHLDAVDVYLKFGVLSRNSVVHRD